MCPHCQAMIEDLGAVLCPDCHRPLPDDLDAGPVTGDPATGGSGRPLAKSTWVFYVVKNNNVDIPPGGWEIPMPRDKLLGGEPCKIGRKPSGPAHALPDVNLHALDAARSEGESMRVSREMGYLYWRDGRLWLVRIGRSKLWHAGANWPADQGAEPVPLSSQNDRHPIELKDGDELTFGSSETDTFTLKISLGASPI